MAINNVIMEDVDKKRVIFNPSLNVHMLNVHMLNEIPSTDTTCVTFSTTSGVQPGGDLPPPHASYVTWTTAH